MMKKLIKNLIPIKYLVPLYNLYLQLIYRFRGINVIHNKNLYRLIKNKKEIRLSDFHKIYLQDILDNYDYYFNGVESAVSKFTQVADYSKPSWHDIKDFELMPIFFNSLSEPIVTAKQYNDFANLSEESIAIDLGAYSGLTSILMDQNIIRKNYSSSIIIQRRYYKDLQKYKQKIFLS
jgi:hypothetical protein